MTTIQTPAPITNPAAVRTDDCAPATRVTRSLLGYGVIAGPVYVVTSLTQAFTRDGFDPTRHAWSQLALGDHGWIQVTNLLVSGLMVIAAAIGVGRALPSRWAPRLLGVYGLGMVVAAFFKADPGRGFPLGTPADAATFSGHGMVHLMAGGVGFIGLCAAAFVLARLLPRGLARLSRVTGVALVAGFVTMNASAGASFGIVAFSVAIVLVSAWLSVVSVHLYRRAGR